MKTKKDYKRAQLVVREVIDAWDPYALLAGGAPKDEFTEEIDLIVRHLPEIKSEEDAIKAISDVMTSAFVPKDFTPDKCSVVGKKLFARCTEEALI